MPLCMECATPIVWVETRNQKRMPVNVNANGRTPNIAVQREGNRLVAARAITADHPVQVHEEAFVAHWATCPAADRFRRSHPSTPARKTMTDATSTLF